MADTDTAVETPGALAPEAKLTPAQSNEIVMAKLDGLEPRLRAMLEQLLQLRADLANGWTAWGDGSGGRVCDD